MQLVELDDCDTSWRGTVVVDKHFLHGPPDQFYRPLLSVVVVKLVCAPKACIWLLLLLLVGSEGGIDIIHPAHGNRDPLEEDMSYFVEAFDEESFIEKFYIEVKNLLIFSFELEIPLQGRRVLAALLGH